jgi:hypothetical protein
MKRRKDPVDEWIEILRGILGLIIIVLILWQIIDPPATYMGIH